MRALAVGSALGVVCAVVLVSCGGEAVSETPTGTILASVRTAEDKRALYLVDVDGGGTRRLTPSSPPTVGDFVVSPDGLVAFAAAGDAAGGKESVWTVGSDGRELRRIGPGSHPAWSVRGELAYIEYEPDGDGRLVMSDPHRGGRRDVPLHLRGSEFLGAPQVSPDGSTVALDIADSAADSGGRVHLVDTRTGNRRPIPTRSWGEHDAAWSADGAFLAFRSTPAEWSPTALDLVITGPDGTGRKTIARSVVGFAWAKTGRRLAYVTEDGGLYARDDLDAPPRLIGAVPGYFLEWAPAGDGLLVWGGARAWVVRLDGGRRVEIKDATNPAWLPDGRVLFVRSGRLYATRVGAGEPTELIRPSSYIGASWSSDGRRLAYVRADPGDGRSAGSIMVVDADGSASTVAGVGHAPSWSPDGNRLAFEDEGDLYVTSLSGHPTRVTSGSERDRGPVWSVQGDMLAFTRSTETMRGEALVSAACVVVVATRAVSCSNRLRPRKPALVEEGPAWSPAEDVVAYASSANEPRGYYVFSEVCFLVGPSATKRGCVEGDEHTAPEWSADGEALVVVGAVDGGIGVASRTGRLISGIPGDPDRTAWAPSGRMLAAGGDVLSVIDARPGTKSRVLVQARVGRPAWSPDSRWLAYPIDRKIAVVRAEGGDPQPIARMPAEVEYLLWRPRGRADGR